MRRAPTPVSPKAAARPRIGHDGRKAWKLRALVLAAVGVVLLAAAAAAWPLARLVLEPNLYAGVRSIEATADYRDPALMRQAWASPVARRYAARPYEFQANQSFCGPTTAADVLHSMGDRRSQGQMLAGGRYHTIFGYLPGGLTLDQEADLLRARSGQSVAVLRGLSLAQFRAQMRAVNDPGRRYVANFHRGPLFGRGHGHFSPLLAYLPDRDLVLVGDVNARFGPFLVPTERLWRAVDTIDPATGLKRGVAVLSVGGR